MIVNQLGSIWPGSVDIHYIHYTSRLLHHTSSAATVSKEYPSCLGRQEACRSIFIRTSRTGGSSLAAAFVTRPHPEPAAMATTAVVNPEVSNVGLLCHFKLPSAVIPRSSPASFDPFTGPRCPVSGTHPPPQASQLDPSLAQADPTVLAPADALKFAPPHSSVAATNRQIRQSFVGWVISSKNSHQTPSVKASVQS